MAPLYFASKLLKNFPQKTSDSLHGRKILFLAAFQRHNFSYFTGPGLECPQGRPEINPIGRKFKHLNYAANISQ